MSKRRAAARLKTAARYGLLGRIMRLQLKKRLTKRERERLYALQTQWSNLHISPHEHPRKLNPPAKATRRKRRNPEARRWYILIQRVGGPGGGPVLVYNGRSFSNQPTYTPKPFATADAARHHARVLLKKHPAKLGIYKVWVSDALHEGAPPSRRVNPSRRDELDAAARLLEDFTGHEATHVERARARSTQKTGLVVGELDLIGYRAKRKGIEGGRLVRYAHKFRKGSRPLLAASTDGKQLHIVGGQYELTEAGIEDR